MREALLIAMREAQERRAVLAAALVAGLLPFASPLLPGVSAARAGEARDAMAAVLALGFGLILSLLLGATAIARDLAENRLGFDFARPIGGLAIWAGRLGAAVGLTLTAMAIVLAPAALVGGGLALPDRAGTVGELWLVVLGAVPLCVGLSHVAGVAFRSRSRWLALDLVGLLVALLIAASGVRQIHDAFARQTAMVAAIAAVVATIPVLWVASAVQVVRGRTDVVLGHRAQSITLWSMLFVLALGLAGYGRWFVAVDFADVERAWAAPAAGGTWIAVSGGVAWRPEAAPQFLVDTTSGRSVLVGFSDRLTLDETLFSRDGARAVRVHRASPGESALGVSTIDLSAAAPEVRETPLVFDLWMPVRPALSPSGRRLATIEEGSLAVHEIDSATVLGAAKLDLPGLRAWGDRVVFVDEHRVRVYALGERLAAHEFDVERRTVRSWIGPAVVEDAATLCWRSDHRRLILRGPARSGTLLLDGDTGAIVARLDDGRPESATQAAFLADGRIVRSSRSLAGRATLEVLSSEGVPERSVDLGAVARKAALRIGAEVAPGTIALASDVSGADRLLLVDLQTGGVRDVAGGGRPVVTTWLPVGSAPEPGSVATRLIAREDSVWLLDPAAATVRLLAGRRG